MKKTLMAGMVSLFFGITLLSCEKTKESTVRIRMTDAPAAYEEVNVDLKQVNIKFDNDTTSWMSMNTRAGIYNLLALQNGIDTLIAEGTFPSGTIKEIRLVLGENNTVKEGGNTLPLTIPSGATSGLKIKVNKKLRATTEELLIDFDALLSVRKEVDGYKLRPVIKLK
jgi:hypothetical protein